MKYQRLLKLKLFIVALLAVSAFTVSASGLSFLTAKAADPVTLSLFNPTSELEYFSLNAPISACYWEGGAAVVQSDRKLYIYSDGEFILYEGLAHNTPYQVKKLGNDKLLVSDNGILYTINLLALSEPARQFLFGDEPISGRYFDINDNHVITIFGTTIHIYTLKNGEIISKTQPLSGFATTNTQVCINQNNEIFYVNDESALCKYTLSDSTENVLVNYAPETMAANNDYVYFSSGATLYRVPVSGGERTPLSLEQTPYDLGKLNTPTDISFKGNNLLITDSSVNAVQEFAINENKESNELSLEFTGFAIAKGKTAFNRIGSNNVNIEKYGDTVAVLDGYKLTLVNAADGKKVFENYLAADLGGTLPNDFALGNKTAMLTYQAQSSIRFINFEEEKEDLSELIEYASGYITDATYSSGKYYLSVSFYNGSKFVTGLYIAEEKNLFSAETDENPFSLIFETDKMGSNPIIAADVDGNIYAADEDNKLYFFDQAENYEIHELSSPGMIKKLATDLNGELFVLTENEMWQYSEGVKTKIDLTADLTGGPHTFSSFAMNFDKKTVYFTLSGEETIFSTQTLNNAAISALKIPEDYTVTGQNADIANLKIFSVSDGANVYSVDAASNRFSFNGLTENVTELVLVNDELENPDFYVLAGESDTGEITVLVNKKWLTEKEVLSEPRFTEAYVSTDVSMYYLPIITRNDVFCLFDGEEIVRLDKKTPFNPIKTFVFLGREFYYAAAEVNGTSVSGYIPANFTVFRLAEDYIRETYTFEKVIATEVTDENGAGVFNLEEGATVRLYSQKDGLSYISYKDGEEWRYGFIESSAIQTTPNTVIRNVAVIFLVTLSVFITSIYFVLKKKKP